MHTYRTRFKKEIVAEFLPPLTRRQRQVSPKKGGPPRDKVVILCGGMPGSPGRSSFLEFWAKKGYWVFYPRYRGSWESGGTFLKYSPEKDILDVIGELPKGFRVMSVKGNKMFRVKPAAVYLVAGSFGGPAGILASRNPRVKKVVAVSPVTEWRAPSKAEPLGWLEKYIRYGFGNGYRFGRKEWAKLRTGKFYNPMAHIKEIDGRKILIYHAKDDESVRWREVAKFARLTGAKLVLRKIGGHLSSTIITKPAEWRRVGKFLKSR